MSDIVFEIGREYKRSIIHDQFGGSRQSGISNSAKYPYIFIFSNKSGSKYGYADGWLNEEIFSYTGAGQTGDMEFKGPNKALKNHINDNKRVFLFEESKRSFVKFINELKLDTFEYFDGHDLELKLRRSIKFFFRVSNRKLRRYNLHGSESTVEEPKEENYHIRKFTSETEKRNWAKHRIGQGAFRQSLLYRWKSRCVVTGCQDTRLLTASHIVSWKESTDKERLDIDNGLLLSPVYDRLFDQHLISFDIDGCIILSELLLAQDYILLGVSGDEKISDLNDGNIQYLKRHRSIFSKTRTS